MHLWSTVNNHWWTARYYLWVLSFQFLILFVTIDRTSALIFPCFIQFFEPDYSYESCSEWILNFLLLCFLSFLISVFLDFSNSPHEVFWYNIVSFIVFAFNFDFYLLILNFVCAPLLVLHFYICFIWLYFFRLLVWFFIKQNWALMKKLRLLLGFFLFFVKYLWFLSHKFFLSLISNKLLINFLII